jgi:hypothetical protein
MDRSIVESLQSALKDLTKKAKKLQQSTNLASVRDLFDATINAYRQTFPYMSFDSSILHSKDFVNAVVKVLSKKEHELTNREAEVLTQSFLLTILLKLQ